MRTLARTEVRQISSHSFGVRVMLLAPEAQCATARRLTEFGGLVEVENEFYAAMSAMIDDPMGYDLFVMECDAFGGMPAAEKAISTLIAADAKMRVMLISSDFDIPAYPLGRRTAVCLPNPASEASLRIGFDHVLRDRVPMRLI